jgi:internalin A
MEFLDISYEKLFEFPLINQEISKIDCSHNNLKTTWGLQDLVNLKSLDISHNFITQIQGWMFLSSLQIVNLSHNNLSCIQGLHQCYKITTLMLQFNQLESISGLETLKNLQYLNLSNNSITDKTSIRPLSLNSKLEVLYLESNPIINYRQLCYSMILSLVMLDGKPTPGKLRKGTVKDSYKLKRLTSIKYNN